MKTAMLIAALSLVVSVSAAAFQENYGSGFQRFGHHGNHSRQGNQQNSNNGQQNNDRLENTNTGSTVICSFSVGASILLFTYLF